MLVECALYYRVPCRRPSILNPTASAPSSRSQFDVLVIGSGLAGQGSALCLADAGLKVGLVSKRAVTDSASGWAQGGIAAVLDSTDSIESHIEDTLVAGAHLNDPAATRFAVEHAADACLLYTSPSPRD